MVRTKKIWYPDSWDLYGKKVRCSIQIFIHGINRGSYMSSHVLLNLLNDLGKRDKMRGLSSILLLLCNNFIEFNNTGA